MKKIYSMETYLVKSGMPVLSAMKLLSAKPHGEQFLMIVDDAGRLKGTLTDGDIRRALISGKDISGLVDDFMHRTPVFAMVSDEDSKVRGQLKSKQSSIIFLPILNPDFTINHIVVQKNTSINSTYALIMAGGFGKRLGEKTRSKPKPLIEVSGKPLLEHVLLNLEQSAVDKVYVSTHFLSDQIRSYIKATGREGYVTILDEKTPLGTAGSIGLLPRDMSGRLIVTNSDVLTDLNYRSFGEFGSNSDRDVSLAIVEHKVYIPFGVVSQSPDGRYASVVEKPVITNNILAGIYCFPTEVIKLLKVDEKLDMPDFLTRVVENKFQINLFPLHEYWTDVGTPEDLSKAISRTQSKS